MLAMPRLPALRLLAVLAALGAVRPAFGAPPAGPEPRTPAQGAVAGLRSPFFRERQEAAQLLESLLPGSRPAIVEAWRSGDEAVRATLARVLVAEASPELVSLVIDAWCRGGDALAAAARGALILDPDATRRGLAAYRAANPGALRPRRPLQAVDELLERDAVERLFLSRKSKSGGTGVYRGQYEVLRAHREKALEVCLHVFMDQALRLPGTSAVGGYRFLRPLRDVVDAWEIRQMALFAISDLATPEDAKIIRALDAYLEELRDLPDSPPGPGWAAFGDRPPANWRPEKDYLFDDLLVTLYRLAPGDYRNDLDWRLRFRDVRARQGWTSETNAAISMRLRAGMYKAAAEGYTRLLWSSESRAADYYNLACTYALWSLEPGEESPERLRRDALTALRSAVDEQWTDIGWLEQDRDLDPIRDTPEFKALVERIRAIISSDKPVPRGPSVRFPRKG